MSVSIRALSVLAADSLRFWTAENRKTRLTVIRVTHGVGRVQRITRFDDAVVIILQLWPDKKSRYKIHVKP